MVVKIITDREVFQPPLHFKLRSLSPDSGTTRYAEIIYLIYDLCFMEGTAVQMCGD